MAFSISNLITAVETYTTEKGLPAPYGANPNAVLSKGDELVYQSAKAGRRRQTLRGILSDHRLP